MKKSVWTRYIVRSRLTPTRYIVGSDRDLVGILSVFPKGLDHLDGKKNLLHIIITKDWSEI